MGQDFVRLLNMIFIHSQLQQGQKWLKRYQGKQACFACILGFTATGLIPGISAAGATPQDRLNTAIADGEFLATGATATPQYPLPYLTTGISPVFISRAIAEYLDLPIYLFNAGLPVAPPISHNRSTRSSCQLHFFWLCHEARNGAAICFNKE